MSTDVEAGPSHSNAPQPSIATTTSTAMTTTVKPEHPTPKAQTAVQSSRNFVRQGDSVMLKLPSDTIKTFKINPDTSISLGKFGSFKGRQLIGKPYGHTFEITHDGNLKVLESTLNEIEETEATNEFIMATGASGLTVDDIQALRKEGLSGREIIAKQIENHAAFDLKTEYSKDKYKKRKEAKYVKAFTLIEPTAHNVCEYNFDKEPAKIRGIRPDTLSQMMTMANVRPGGRLLVVEDVHGLVVGAAVERMAGEGRIFVISDIDSPPDLHIVEAFNLPLSCTDPLISSIHWAATEPEWTLPALPTQIEPNPTAAADVTAVSDVNPSKQDDSKPTRINSREVTKIKKRKQQFEKVEQARKDFFNGEFDGVILATEYEPWSVLDRILPRIAGSAPIVVYSPHLAVLYACQDKMRIDREYLAPSITEPWLRRYQVLPGRTHPEMQGMQHGGFLLTATRVFDDVEVESAQTRRRSKKLVNNRGDVGGDESEETTTMSNKRRKVDADDDDDGADTATDQAVTTGLESGNDSDMPMQSLS
ncbi:tRNA (adenine(58)-N(1))-methyltransferase non-catalytic subunit trm6 [Microbotryomycetes sp. JL221]|nr:tRNA (adenine(58)-N(1))-methyltransferase non-catalytic subunit trm6 [Microbotryomycetes sp. JL221]